MEKEQSSLKGKRAQKEEIKEEIKEKIKKEINKVEKISNKNESNPKAKRFLREKRAIMPGKKTDVDAPLVCKECNGTHLVMDESGYLVCINCGAQLTEYGPQHFPVPDKKIDVSIYNSAEHIRRGTNIGRPEERFNNKFNILAKINNRYEFAYRETVFSYAYQELRRICGSLELSVGVSDILFEMFKKVWKNAQEFKSKDIRSIDKLIPVVIYRGVRYMGMFIKLHKILEFSNIDTKKFKEIFIRTYVLFPAMDKARVIKQYIANIMKDLPIEKEYRATVQDFAVRVYKANRRAIMNTSELISAAASIALSVLCNMPKDKMTPIATIAKAASSTSSSAISKRISRVLKYKNIDLKNIWEYKKELYKYKDVLLREPSDNPF
ncbi:MAG: hypothetical protein ACTSVV_07395 [Promethearchaeota archaeon]